MRIHGQPAFVLHHHFYRESSLLLELFTPDYGRIGVIAKGARRPRSRIRPVLQPFQPLLAGWSGKGELATLTGAEMHGRPVTLAGENLYCGYYMNELLMRFLHRHDPHKLLYDAYSRAVHALAAPACEGGRRPHADGGAAAEAILRVFEKHLLGESGYGLVLDREIQRNEPLAADAWYEYILDRGPVRVDDAPHAKARGVRIRGASLIALAEERPTGESVLNEIKLLMRASIAQHLGERPLRTRKLLQSMRPSIPAAPVCGVVDD